MTDVLTFRLDRRLPIAVLRFAGRLTTGTSPVARTGLQEALAAEPSSVIVDLSDLAAAEDLALTLFPAVADQAARWPGAPLLLSGPPPAVADGLTRMAVDRRLPVHPDLGAALAVATLAPVPRQLHRALEPTVHAPRVARALAAHACWEWNLAPLAAHAEIVSSELVTNAVRHAGTMIDLSVSLRDRELRISVHDRHRRSPRLQSPGESDDHGRGLLIVDTISAGWGHVELPEGKTVWAVLRSAGN